MRPIPYFAEGEVWSCYLGKNIGHEQNGSGKFFMRPVVILKKYNKDLFLGIPLTTKIKNLSFYYDIGKVDKKHSCAILIQCRPLSSSRLTYKIDVLDGKIFNEMKSAAEAYSFGS